MTQALQQTQLKYNEPFKPLQTSVEITLSGDASDDQLIEFSHQAFTEI